MATITKVKEKIPQNLVTDFGVPNVDINAPLEIEKATKSVPSVDMNASLDIEKYSNEVQSQPKKKTNILFYLFSLLSLAVVALILVGVWYLFTNSKENEIEVVNIVTISENDQELTDQKMIDKSEINVEILNATNTPGYAKKTSEALKDLGYGNFVLGDYEDSESSNLLFVSSDLLGQKDELLSGLLTAIEDLEFAGELEESEKSIKIVLGN